MTGLRKLLIGVAAAGALLAGQAQAGVVFSDNFDTENGGFSAFNYEDFANFVVSGSGSVDIIANGSFFNCPGPGMCVDLDGTPGPARMTSIASFSFNAGDRVELSFDLSGNQRGAADDTFYAGFAFTGSTSLLDYGFNYAGSDVVVGDFFTGEINTTSVGIPSSQPFSLRSVFFTAGSAGTLNFYVGTDSADNFGTVLDNVQLSVGPSAVVPEPGAWALMIAGFGLAGAALRRRRTVLARI